MGERHWPLKELFGGLFVEAGGAEVVVGVVAAEGVALLGEGTEFVGSVDEAVGVALGEAEDAAAAGGDVAVVGGAVGVVAALPPVVDDEVFGTKLLGGTADCACSGASLRAIVSPNVSQSIVVRKTRRNIPTSV